MKNEQAYKELYAMSEQVCNDIKTLLDMIIPFYQVIHERWLKDEQSINFKKVQVRDVIHDVELEKLLGRYITFLEQNAIYLAMQLNTLISTHSIISYRVKAKNSITNKLNRYLNTNEQGKIPLNKCLNDLLGLRIISNAITHEQVIECMQNYNASIKLKCTNSSKKQYIATHIYFADTNTTFPWELQIWDKKYKEANILSHRKYKQEYTAWENYTIKGKN